MTARGNFSVGIPAALLPPPFKAGNNSSPARAEHRVSVHNCSVWLLGRRQGERKFYNPHFQGCLSLLHPQEPSWDVELH